MKMSQPICNNIPGSLFWKCAEFAGLYSPMSQVKRCIMLELLTVFAEFLSIDKKGLESSSVCAYGMDV